MAICVCRNSGFPGSAVSVAYLHFIVTVYQAPEIKQVCEIAANLQHPLGEAGEEGDTKPAVSMRLPLRGAPSPGGGGDLPRCGKWLSDSGLLHSNFLIEAIAGASSGS